MAELKLVPWAPGDRGNFVDEAAYQNYLKLEAEVNREPLDFVLDWRYLLQTIWEDIYGSFN